MRARIGGLAVCALLMLGGCSGPDLVWQMSQWGCAVGNCLPNAPSGVQCLSSDIDGQMWLSRSEAQQGAVNGAQRQCAAESGMPESCFVVPNDCQDMFLYCPGGEGNNSAACRLYGPPGAAEAPRKG